MDEQRAREAVAGAVRRLDELGLNHNSSGNVSLRFGDDLLVTPSGIPAAELGTEDMVLLHADGMPASEGQRAPTSEWQLHTAIARRRPDIEAIVHTHSVEATAAACLGMELPPIHYVAARFGRGGLACAPYATYGTAELAENVSDALGGDSMACLMAHHGAVALGPDLDAAVALALDVEWFCAVLRRAYEHGDPIALPEDEIERVSERFESYGKASSIETRRPG